jgi:aspartate dehydrogenase
VVGVGSIGRCIIRHIADGKLAYRLAAVCDNDEEQTATFLKSLGLATPCLPLQELVGNCDVAVEAAAAEVVPRFVAACRESFAATGRPAHLLVMSVGGLLKVDLEAYRDASSPTLHVPAGAIGGLEALQALAVAGLDEVTLTTRKPPAGLGEEVTGETVLFEGPAAQVFELFPKNINVAIALSLAGIGPQRTMVRLIADPAVSRNSHTIHARGPAGELSFISQNEPFPENPKTSYLAALSAIALLKRIGSRIQVG